MMLSAAARTSGAEVGGVCDPAEPQAAAAPRSARAQASLRSDLSTLPPAGDRTMEA